MGLGERLGPNYKGLKCQDKAFRLWPRARTTVDMQRDKSERKLAPDTRRVEAL